MEKLVQLLTLLAAATFSTAAAAAAVTAQVSDSTGKPLADAIVVIDPDGAASMPKLQRPAQIEQRGLKFLPMVSVIQTGSTVSFPNNDKVKHHIYSFSPAKKFDQKLYSGVAAAPQVFDKAGLVVIGCNIHDRMVAYIKVVDSPWFARTDAAGMVSIDVPPGARYSVSAWHYNMSGTVAAQALALKADAPAPLAFKLTMKAPPADPEAGY